MDNRENEQRQHRHLHVVGLDFLAEIFRRAADHQTGDEDREHDEDEHSVESGADAAENDFAELDVEQRNETAERGERIVHRIDRAARRVGRDRGKERGVEDAEADFLALHVAVGRGDAELLMNRIARRFGPPAEQHAADKQDRHRRPNRPAVLLVLDHSAEVISEPAADRENRKHLEEIRERRRILERMRRVGVGVTAAIRAEHLDRDLRRHRTLHDVLFGDGLFFHHRLVVSALDRLALVVFLLDLDFHRLHQRRLGVTVEILNHPLRHQKDREDEANGQQQVIGHAHEIDPEIADGLGRMARDRPDKRGGDGNAGRGGNEIVKGQRDHLREIRHGGFAAVALPIGVGGETDRGVESEIVAHRCRVLADSAAGYFANAESRK